MKLKLNKVQGGWEWQAWSTEIVAGSFVERMVDRGFCSTQQEAIAEFRFLYAD